MAHRAGPERAVTLAWRSEDSHPLLAALGLSTGRFAAANLNVHAGDEMLIHYGNIHPGDPGRALALYFDSGRRIWETMWTLLRWRFGEPGPDFRMLDFASGYGRMTRFAVLNLPPERIRVSDISREGVRFQEEQFGVRGIVSHAAPERFDPGETFDAILVSSLFTHLPEDSFRAWLRRLRDLLRPGGMLGFSVHGEEIVPPGREIPPEGVLFDPKSEIDALPGEQYGTTWVSEAFVRRALPEGSAHRIRRGLLLFQDLWVIVPEPGCDFSGLTLRLEPESFVEHCSAGGGRLRISGWVMDRVRRSPPVEVRLILGDARHVLRDLPPRDEVAALFPYERVDARGWRFDVPLSEGDLTVEAVGASGEVWRLYADTVPGAFLRSARLDLHDTLRRAEETEARRLRETTELERVIHVLEARIAGMEASRFWKMREVWFRIKKRLGR
ncbi:MAG TPA: methyltransferase [Thermoanaerobaculia bacterium]|nr:methyltransferase [Thermoanaerobaculia bacterium]